MLTGSAFILGLFGSLHCVGMCGPIAVAVGNQRMLQYRILYNLGRTITYVLLGAIFGILGMGISLAGSQQFLSIFMGITLILGALISFPNRSISIPPIQWMVNKIKVGMSKFLKSDSRTAPFLIGIINGFLPCGLVYVAIAAALATGNAANGALYMGLFGLGTIPALLILSYSWTLVKHTTKFNVKRLVPVFVTIIGLLFILRGLDLGIPYVSPKLDSDHSEMHHHQHEMSAKPMVICGDE